VATVNGLDVFTAQLAPTHSCLFSRPKVESIAYQFEDGDDPAQGRVAIRFCQQAMFRPCERLSSCSDATRMRALKAWLPRSRGDCQALGRRASVYRVLLDAQAA
jgi:hypothetical protein